MRFDLSPYQDRFPKAPAGFWEELQTYVANNERNLSQAGLGRYVDGAAGLAQLGKGYNVVEAWLAHMPAVAKEAGEDMIGDTLAAVLKLSSMTSGEVMALLIASLPAAATQLGDPDLLRGYLALIHQISAKAARGLRPMFSVMDELLAKLTLSGLRRWANYGAEAYRRDFQNLTKYFALETADSRKVFQQERRGTLFVSVQRKTNFYLRALWGRDFFMRPTTADFDGFRPFIEDNFIFLPDAVDPLDGITGDEIYRAMAAHLAAHMIYTRQSINAEGLAPAQMFFIALIEDARVEWNAVRDFPGLKTLWKKHHAIDRTPRARHESMDKLEAFAHALLDNTVTTGDPALDELAIRFHEEVQDHPLDAQISWDIGTALYNKFATKRELPSLRILNSIGIAYRDDNRFVWDFDESEWAREAAGRAAPNAQVRKYVSVMEMAHEVDTELAGDDAQEVWICKDEFMPYEDAGEAKTSFNDMWGKAPISEPYYYNEWDCQLQISRPDWATVYERWAKKGNAKNIDEILTEYKHISHRLRQIIDKLSPVGVERVRNMEDGDEIDINAAIDAMIAMRMGAQPNPRITMRNVIKSRDLAVTVLLDLSESTNDQVEGSGKTVLDLTKDAATLVATAISGIGDPFAIHGFASDGRADVQYFKFKDFSERFDDEVKARLDGMRGALSTRMGAALRHAAASLEKQAEKRKLILLVTDGAPADVDERDPQMLRKDTKKAVEELAGKGVLTYCLTLDPYADQYVRNIFGANHYTIIDHVERLPEKLPTLFASLTS